MFRDKKHAGRLKALCFSVVVWAAGAHAVQSTDTALNPDALPVVSGKIVEDELQVIYNIPDDRHQTLQQEFNMMTVDVAPVDGISFGETVYPEGDRDAEGNIEYHGMVVLRKSIQAATQNIPDSLTVTAGYQFCTPDGTCLFPESVMLRIPFPDYAGASIPSSTAVGTVLLNLLFAFLGGLILNIMPCVLPVLSVNIMRLMRTAQQHRREIFKGAMAYTFGVLLSFLALGGVVAALKIAGQSVGWGFQFQNIGFVVFLIAVIWVFGLALFDLVVIQLPGMQTASKAGGKQGHLGSFLTGVFVVLLATPCTAPLLGAALGWTFTQPPWMIVMSFLVIGLGLAFPFVLIGIFPVFVKIVPRPGPWMNTFKMVMGFLLMAMVVHLLHVAFFLVESAIIQILWFMLVIAIALWILGHYASPVKPKRTRLAATIVAILMSAYAGFHFLRFDETAVPVPQGEAGLMQRDPHHPEWIVFSPELLDRFVDEKKPVFIDFAAEWCLTCKTNEITVLFTDEIQLAFREHGVQLLRGDFTKKNPIIQEWLQKFNRAGVPLYVFYPPGREPVVLPEVLSKEMVLGHLRKR